MVIVRDFRPAEESRCRACSLQRHPGTSGRPTGVHVDEKAAVKPQLRTASLGVVTALRTLTERCIRSTSSMFGSVTASAASAWSAKL